MLLPWVRASGIAPLVYCPVFSGGAFCATTMEYGKRGNGEKEGLTELEGISANELVFFEHMMAQGVPAMATRIFLSERMH